MVAVQMPQMPDGAVRDTVLNRLAPALPATSTADMAAKLVGAALVGGYSAMERLIDGGVNAMSQPGV